MWRMHLDEYLSSTDSLTVGELRRRMNAFGYAIESDAQIRQWRHRYSGRMPSPKNCTGLELATEGRVARKAMRPEDWHLIWPELCQKEGPCNCAQPIKTKEPELP